MAKRPTLAPDAHFKKKGVISPACRAALAKTNEARKGTKLNATTRNALLSLDEQDRDQLPDRPRKQGRSPFFLDKPDLADRFIELIEEGHYYNTACNMVGWNYDSVMQWLDKGSRGVDKDYYDWWCRVKQAEANAEVSLHEKIAAHHAEDWKSVAWVMERRFADRWGRREAIRPTVVINNTNQTVNVKDELATKVIEHDGARDFARGLLTGSGTDDT